MSQSSALHRMAAGEHDAKPVKTPVSAATDDAQFAHVDVEPGESSPQPSSPRPRASRPTPRRNDQSLKAMAVPVLATVGGLLLIPAIWATLLLAGMGVWQSDRPDARTMALAMLAAWPIALCLVAGAGFFWWQLQQNKK